MSISTYEYQGHTIICLYDENNNLVGRFTEEEGSALSYWIGDTWEF